MMSIKVLRQKKGITQTQLAKLIGVQPSIISRYEAGKLIPTFKKMEALAQVFEIDTHDFIITDENNTEFFLETENKKISNLEWYRRLLLAATQGRCELCKSPAPFRDADGRPYLQLFEIDKNYSGKDFSKNIVALCPTCYQRIKVLADEKDIEQIKVIAEQHEF